MSDRKHRRMWDPKLHEGKRQADCVLELLRQAPVTARDVADELGVEPKIASAVLGVLFKNGQATRSDVVIHGSKGRRVLYTLVPEVAT